VVMNQALYTKATEIIWKQTVLIRMEVFHSICNALSILGKRFHDADLKDICIEVGLVVKGSINSVLDGKHYSCVIKVHKCVYEALMRLIWAQFLSWTENDHKSNTTANMFFEQANILTNKN